MFGTYQEDLHGAATVVTYIIVFYGFHIFNPICDGNGAKLATKHILGNKTLQVNLQVQIQLFNVFMLLSLPHCFHVCFN